MRMVLVGLVMVLIINHAQGQWLPKAEEDRIKALMKEKGIPVSETLRFYSLPRVFQFMVTMNRAPLNEVRAYSHGEATWMNSGGLHHVNRSEWRNVTGLDLGKDGKITVWSEGTNVRASSGLISRTRWSFPSGTTMFDILIRKSKDGKDSHIFEARARTKTDGKWDDGETWRPDIQVSDKLVGDKYTWAHQSAYYARGPLGAEAKAFELPTFGNEIMKKKFKISKRLVIDQDHVFYPPGYVGAGMSCTNCHQFAGLNSDVQREIYKEVQPGDDTVHSWSPFNINGQGGNGRLDMRWPLILK